MTNVAGFAPELIQALRSAAHIAALTGAGISAESGVPTFRQAQTGLWARFDPAELATLEAFVSQPKLVWDWYAWRRELVARARPNAGHLALAEMARRARHFTLITQNVDGLHQTAGSAEVIELHGSLLRSKCLAEGTPVDEWPDTADAPPRCPRCGAMLRPDVVWFGEMLPPAALQAAWAAAEASSVFLSVGTSATVEPAASLPDVAARAGALVVEVNPEDTPLTGRADYSVRGLAGEVLPALVRAAWPGAE